MIRICSLPAKISISCLRISRISAVGFATESTERFSKTAVAGAKEKELMESEKIRQFQPKTSGTRFRVDIDRSELWKGGPIRSLTVGMRKTGGRGHKGQVSVRHRGGGHKRRYRFIDFKRNLFDIPATVIRLEYDPNRSSHIALVEYENDEKELRYIIAPQELTPGMKILSSRTNEIPIKVGNCMPLKMMPIGTTIHNLEYTPGKGGQIARSAGQSCELVDKLSKPGYCLVKLKSTELRYFLQNCCATVGVVSNPLHNRIKLGKAGRTRWLGRRPKVRGVAMNPVDHPMGGGQGKTKGGRPSCSPTGQLAKGYRTRKRKPNPLILTRRGETEKALKAAA